MVWLVALGLLPLAAGLLAFLVPAQAWAAVAPRGSRLAHQASTAALLLFGGLAWLGLALVILYSHALWLGWRSTRWIPVPGTVQESRLITTSQPRSARPAYRAEVVYAYAAAGREFLGMRVDFAGTATGDRDFVEAALRTRFAPGAPVTVHVDPADPGESVLEPGALAKALICGGTGLVFLAVGAFQLVRLRRDWSGDGTAATKTPRGRRREKSRGRR